MQIWQRLIRKRYLKVIIVLILAVFVVLYLFILQKPSKESVATNETLYLEEGDSQDESKEDSQKYVDLKGEVVRPGMYAIETDQRLIEIVEVAGGFTENADSQKVNFAQVLEDQMVIVVPRVGDMLTDSFFEQAGSDQVEGKKININKANTNELQSLNGIGAKKAEDIIQYREKNGLYQSIEELGKVSGIGEKTLESLKESITIK